MPKQINKGAAASKTRKSAHQRKVGPDKGCKGSNGGTADHSSIIANSIFALTLPVKRAFEAKTEISVFEKPVGEIATDLLQSLNRALWLLKKPRLKLQEDLSQAQKMTLIIDTLKLEVLPKGYEFEINKDGSNGSYFFTLYKPVEFGSFWHCFPVKPVLDQLKKAPGLKQCFLDIISLLIYRCGFNAWWMNWYPFDFVLNDEFGFADWFHNGFYDLEEAEKENKWELWKQLREDYRKGEAYACQKELKSRKPCIKRLKQRLYQRRSARPIVSWMKKALQLIESGKSIHYFNNEFWNENEGQDGRIRLEDQVMIIWNEDELFDIGCEQVDAEWSNFGMQEPANIFHLFSDQRKLDFSQLQQEEKWMLSVTHLYDNYQKNIIAKLVK